MNDEVLAADLVSAVSLFRAVSSAHAAQVRHEFVLLPETMFDRSGMGTALPNGIARDRMRHLNARIINAHGRKDAAVRLKQLIANSPVFPLRAIDPGNGDHPVESSEAAERFKHFLDSEIAFQSSFLDSLANWSRVRISLGHVEFDTSVEAQCFLNLVYFFRDEALALLNKHGVPCSLGTGNAYAAYPRSAGGKQDTEREANAPRESSTNPKSNKRDRMTPLLLWIKGVMEEFQDDGKFVEGARGLVWEKLRQQASSTERPTFVVGSDLSEILYTDPRGEVQHLMYEEFGRKFDSLKKSAWTPAPVASDPL